MLAPEGCTQYFTEDQGTIYSYGYGTPIELQVPFIVKIWNCLKMQRLYDKKWIMNAEKAKSDRLILLYVNIHEEELIPSSLTWGGKGKNMPWKCRILGKLASTYNA